jgi:hypothetical protein
MRTGRCVLRDTINQNTEVFAASPGQLYIADETCTTETPRSPRLGEVLALSQVIHKEEYDRLLRLAS